MPPREKPEAPATQILLIPPPPNPPFDLDTFEPIDPPWPAIREWITSLPATEAKDTAISGLVDYLITESSEPDPLAAAHWAAASIDPAGRDRRVQRVAEAWFRRDPQGAPAAIAGSGLPSEIKQSLLDHAPSPR